MSTAASRAAAATAASRRRATRRSTKSSSIDAPTSRASRLDNKARVKALANGGKLPELPPPTPDREAHPREATIHANAPPSSLLFPRRLRRGRALREQRGRGRSAPRWASSTSSTSPDPRRSNRSSRPSVAALAGEQPAGVVGLRRRQAPAPAMLGGARGADPDRRASRTAANPPTYWDRTKASSYTCDITTPVQAHVGISDVFAESVLEPAQRPRQRGRQPGARAGDDLRGAQRVDRRSRSAPRRPTLIFGFGAGSRRRPLDRSPSSTCARLDLRHAADARRCHRRAGHPVEGRGRGQQRAPWSTPSPRPTSRGHQERHRHPQHHRGGRRPPLHAPAGLQALRAELRLSPRLQARCKLDKRNVREGRYAIWGPLHLLQRTDIDAAEQQYIKRAVDYVTGARQLRGLNLIEVEAAKHVIPQCAMRASGPRARHHVPVLAGQMALAGQRDFRDAHTQRSPCCRRCS